MDAEASSHAPEARIDKILNQASWPIVYFAYKGGVTVEELAKSYETTPRVIRVMLRRWHRRILNMKFEPSSPRIE